MIETIENSLKDKLQRNIKLYLKNKLYKEGKFILYKYNNFKIELIIKQKNEIKKIEIPIPFKIEDWKEDSIIYFDYRICSLSNNNSKLNELLKIMSKDCSNKFFDTILEINYGQ